ncbi:unnamed protein product, partial [Nesidiocoris tenuis]
MSDSEGKKSSTAPSAASVEEFKRKKLINLARSVQRINEQGREAIQKQEAVLQFKDNDLHEELQQFWKLEEPTPSTVRHPEDDICEELFLKTHYRLSSGQYVVHLPFKGVVPSLHDSIHFATKRYLNLENKFKKDRKLQSMYSEFIQEYVDLGHASLTRSPTAYAIPHHAVFKQEGDRCKIRVVFDGSAKASNGSLNDYLM